MFLGQLQHVWQYGKFLMITLVAERLTSRADCAGAASISSCSCGTQCLATCAPVVVDPSCSGPPVILRPLPPAAMVPRCALMKPKEQAMELPPAECEGTIQHEHRS